MALKWGFSTLGCPEAGLPEVLRLAERYGFQAVELRFLDGTADLNGALSRFLGTPGNADALSASPVAIRCLATPFALASPIAADMDALKRSALLADRVNAPYLRVFDGPGFAEPLAGEQREAARANFEEWREWRARRGVRAEIALETHGATASTRRTLELFELLEARLPVIWDTHHTMILAGEEPATTWAALGGDVVEVHLKDSVARPSARHPYTYVLPGEGRIPVPAILSMLERERFAGVAVLEWERKWHPYLPPLEEAIRAMAAAGWREGY